MSDTAVPTTTRCVLQYRSQHSLVGHHNKYDLCLTQPSQLPHVASYNTGPNTALWDVTINMTCVWHSRPNYHTLRPTIQVPTLGFMGRHNKYDLCLTQPSQLPHVASYNTGPNTALWDVTINMTCVWHSRPNYHTLRPTIQVPTLGFMGRHNKYDLCLTQPSQLPHVASYNTGPNTALWDVTINMTCVWHSRPNYHTLHPTIQVPTQPCGTSQ